MLNTEDDKILNDNQKANKSSKHIFLQLNNFKSLYIICFESFKLDSDSCVYCSYEIIHLYVTALFNKTNRKINIPVLWSVP